MADISVFGDSVLKGVIYENNTYKVSKNRFSNICEDILGISIENALIKARAYSKNVSIPVFAMDDNLYLENVPEENQPGMYVRRVNGKRLNDEEMIKHYTNLVKEYGTNGKLTCRWVYGMAVINNGQETTYSWSKEDFYMVDKPSNKINPGYPLNTISINKKLNKYFTDITEEDKAILQEDESDVVEFIAKSLKNRSEYQ